ncbi:homocysteine S-methyltransferase family protein [Candidatus Hodgkinia cicadicola]|uniref:homocysteine S-methyltransferase family protein n=1 Tax=Candidatus Hodgkinia cicadicola TaxID=573658 RepID=UPI0011BAA23C
MHVLVDPTNKTLMVSSDVLRPTYRDISFNEMITCYKQQINTVLNKDVTMLLIEAGSLIQQMSKLLCLFTCRHVVNKKTKYMF